MQINFKALSIGLLILSFIQSGGGNIKKHMDTQAERAEHKNELDAALAAKEIEFDSLNALSELAIGRLNTATMVVDCATRKNTDLIEGMEVCLPNGSPIKEGIVATWLLSTGEVTQGRVTGVAKVGADDTKEAREILKRRGGF